jgi:hypothetical protein
MSLSEHPNYALEETVERANRHRELAEHALEHVDTLDAIAHALIALEARVDELGYYVARS